MEKFVRRWVRKSQGRSGLFRPVSAAVCARFFRILAVVDDCTRECLALVADTSISGRRVARELNDIIRRRGQRPDTIVSDNGTELTSNAILAGRMRPASAGITSRPANRSRTASSRASTADCATSC